MSSSSRKIILFVYTPCTNTELRCMEQIAMNRYNKLYIMISPYYIRIIQATPK